MFAHKRTFRDRAPLHCVTERGPCRGRRLTGRERAGQMFKRLCTLTFKK